MYTRCRAPDISPGNPFVPDFPQNGEATSRYSRGLWLTRLVERRVVNNFRLGLRGASGRAPSYNCVRRGVALISFRPLKSGVRRRANPRESLDSIGEAERRRCFAGKHQVVAEWPADELT